MTVLFKKYFLILSVTFQYIDDLNFNRFSPLALLIKLFPSHGKMIEIFCWMVRRDYYGVE